MISPLKNLFHLNEGPWRWAMGFQAALGMGLPIAVFTLLGEQSLGLITSLGGFTGLFCANVRRKDRLRILPLVGLGLSLASAAGVWSSSGVYLPLISLLVVTLVACIFTFGKKLNPPGPIFFVLITAVSGYIAAHSDPANFMFGLFQIPLMVALGAFIAYVVVASPLLLQKVRKKEAQRERQAFYTAGFHWSSHETSKTIKVVVGVALAGVVALYFGANRSYWIIIPVIAVLQGGLNKKHTTIRAFHRILGTIIGIFLFSLIASFEPEGMLLVVLIMTLQFLTEVVVAKNYGLALIFITPLALSIATAVNKATLVFTIRERLIDTVLGAGIALTIFFLTEWTENGRKNSKKP